MNKNGYVNFNFLDSKPNINNILVGLDLDYSNKVIAPDGHELALIAFMPIENLLTIAPQFKTDFQDMESFFQNLKLNYLKNEFLSFFSLNDSVLR